MMYAGQLVGREGDIRMVQVGSDVLNITIRSSVLSPVAWVGSWSDDKMSWSSAQRLNQTMTRAQRKCKGHDFVVRDESDSPNPKGAYLGRGRGPARITFCIHCSLAAYYTL